VVRFRLLLLAMSMAAAALVGVGALWSAARGHAAADLAARSAAVRTHAASLLHDLSRAVAEGDAKAAAAAARSWLGEQHLVARAVVRGAAGVTLADVAAVSGQGAADSWIGGLARRAAETAGWGEVSLPVCRAPGVMAGRVDLTIDREPVVHGVVSLVRNGIAATCTGIGVCAVLVAGGAYWATRTLERLRSRIVEMTAGRFGFAPLPRRGPLADLARDFNELAGRVESLTRTSRELANIMESMVDYLIVVDQQAKILRVNRAALMALGYSEAELVGRTASLVCEAEGHALTPSQLEAFLGGGSRQDQEVTFIAKGGKRIPVSLSGSAIAGPDGRATGYVCIGTDITERKEAEAERERLHRQLVTSSRHAGMAVVATGVLHNVGNVLNSVNVSASVVEESLKSSRVPRLKQAADLLAEHRGDLAEFLSRDERGRMLPDYLGRLATHLVEEQSRLIEEMGALNRHVGHIRDIISVQQSTATASGLVEPVSVAGVVEDALRVMCGSVERHQIELVKDFAELPPAVTDRHKLLQILVNLLGNAVDAVKETAHRRSGRIEVRVRPEGEEAQAVEVRDNGVGIPPENLDRIFTHGFTTKKNGHGFGLHSAALAAREIGGTLAAASDGQGAGAVFTLVVPREVRDRSAAAPGRAAP
jgi:PAS domain S-box-containing protein